MERGSRMRMVRYSLPGLGILTLTMLGILLHNTPLLCASIIAICVVVGLVVFGKVEKGYYPYLLYFIALTMVLMFTLAGPHVIGSDVHLEYYFAQLYSGGDVWEPLRLNSAAAAMGSTVIPPFLRVYGISPLWTFKVVYPICFAFVPVMLYLLFTRWISERKAFLASMVVIIFPGFLLEMPGIPEAMLAEVFLVLTLFLIIRGDFKLRYRIPLIITCGVLASLIHYSVGILLIIMLFVSFIAKICLRVKGQLSTKMMGLVLVMILVGSLSYFTIAAQGAVASQLSSFYNKWVPSTFEIHLERPPLNPEAPQPTILKPEPKPPTDELAPTNDEPKPTNDEPKPTPPLPWYKYHESLMKTALGLDFLGVGPLGKTFRILQWIMGLCILMGLVLFRKNKEYLMFAIGAFFLLVACLIPGVSPILNASRFFHFALLLLAPACVIGGLLIFRNPKALTLCFIIPYFLFTSGFIFEVARQDDISYINIPYSIALSDYRLDLGATITKNDLAVADWIAESKTTFPLYADIAAGTLITEKVGVRAGLVKKIPKFPIEMPSPPYFVFIRERNIWDGKLLVWKGIGCRKHSPFEEYSINVDENIIYQVGDARVVKVEWE